MTGNSLSSGRPDAGQRVFSLTLEPNSIYSLSTTTGQQKGSFNDVPAAEPFSVSLLRNL